jgi:Kdo2-lipid IVA lauroyltransferase/acyltransferase
MDKIVPPLHWFLANAERRSRARKYWVVDPFVGVYNTILHYAMRLLSIDACSNLGAFLSFYSPFFFRESDARARKAWIRLRPAESDPASVDAAMRRLWRCISRTMAEYSVIDRFWDAGRISVEGVEHLHAARAAGKPMLITPVHLGNWEIGLVSAGKLGLAGSGIYMPLENRFDMRLAIKTRNRYNQGQVPAFFGPGVLQTALNELRERGGPFVIYVDEFIRGRVQAPAFGRPLRVEGNIGYAVRLAAMTNAALIPAYCVRLNDSAHFKLRFLPPIDLLQTGNRKADAVANIERLNAVIEPIVLEHLDQWYFLLDIEFDD